MTTKIQEVLSMDRFISIRPSKDIRTNYAQISALTRENPVAITVNGNVAEIDYSKCTGCGKCEQVCPRKIIWSAYKKTTVENAEPAVPNVTEE